MLNGTSALTLQLDHLYVSMLEAAHANLLLDVLV